MSKKQVTWIDEQTAATLLGYAPRVLRRKVIAGLLEGVRYFKGGKSYQYSKESIEEYKYDKSIAA